MSLMYEVDVKFIHESWLIEFTLPGLDDPRTYRVDQDYQVTPMTPAADEWMESPDFTDMLISRVKYMMERNLVTLSIVT